MRKSESYLSESSLGNFAFDFIVVVDILWSASMRRISVVNDSNDDFARLLSNAEYILQITGCEQWVFECMSSANRLRIWKQTCTTTQSLNITELVKRARVLEEKVQYHSAGTALRRQLQSTSRDVSTVTDVYAAAVQTYIHVIVSGPFPEVSDIRRAVDLCVTALRSISHASLVRRLAWPICVAACLSDSRHETFFTQIESGARRDQDECASVLRGLQIARQCRRLRDLSSKTASFDWMDAMDSLGQEWILF
jgi:hypothetical protein